MTKTILSLALVLIMLTAFPAAAAGGPAITEKELPFCLMDAADVQPRNVYTIGDSDVPYVSLRDWAELMSGLMCDTLCQGSAFALSFRMDGETGVLTRENDCAAAFDCAADSITFYDYDAFLRPDSDGALMDVFAAPDTGLFRRAEDSFTRRGDVLVLDLASYGIDLVTDGTDCYAPLQTMSDFLLSPLRVNAFYNGEAVVFAGSGSLGSPEAYTALGELLHAVEPRERSRAMADFSYAELCLALDSLCGPGPAGALESFETLCEQTGLAEMLRSTDPAAADEGLCRLIALCPDALHSRFIAPSPLNGKYAPIDRGEPAPTLALQRYKAARDMAFPDGVPAYEEIGNTAYITLDSFAPIPEGVDYYETAPTAEAEDAVGVMLYACSRITREDSPIENVVLDLSCNIGGSADAAIFTVAAFLGRSSASVSNALSGAAASGVYEIDLNLDRAFDEGDRVLSEKNLYCLISPACTACGSLAASAFRDSEAVTLLGRASGGGGCDVLPLSTADGACFRLPGPMRLSFAKNGSLRDIEQGALPDFTLSRPASFYARAALTAWINTLL